MKQYIWSIKVGDLLRNPWATDVVHFENQYIRDMETLREPGISWTIELLSLNSTSIQVTLSNIRCSVNDISDISWHEFIRDVVIESYEAIFCIPNEKQDIDEIYESYEDVYEIQLRDFSVDVSLCLDNAIKSQEPVVKIKNDESLWEWWIEVVDFPDI